MSDQPTTGYDKHLADQHADEVPEDRVRAYVDAVSPYITQIADDGAYQLDTSDLRDVLNELDAYRSVVDRATLSALIVLAKPGTVTDTDRKNAAVRIAEIVLGMTDKETDQ